MTIQRVDDMTEAPIVGRYYLVRCVKLGSGSGHGWWPVTGSVHEDADLGIPHPHLHHDVRFMSEHECRNEWRDIGHVMWMVLRTTAITVAAQYRRRKCQRVQTSFPLPARARDTTSFEEHQQRHVGMVAEACRTCPHRGMRLTALPVEADGGVTCPGHGLRWNATTGALMPRVIPTPPPMTLLEAILDDAMSGAT